MKSISSSWLLSKYKAFEIEFTNAGNVLELSLVITTKRDHPGLKFVLSLFRYDISLQLYDTRHWDYENNCYVKETEWNHSNNE